MICPGCGRALAPTETCAACAAGAPRPVARPLLPLGGDEALSGRTAEIEQLRALIAQDGVALVVLHAAAGAGRTSLIEAGILPALDPAHHRAVRVAPLADVDAALASAAASGCEATPVIVLDPLEDLFTATESAPLARVTAALLALLEGPRPVKVLLSTRTELRPFLRPLESALGDRARSFELSELEREPLAHALIAAAAKHPAPFPFTRYFPERLADEIVWASRGGAGPRLPMARAVCAELGERLAEAGRKHATSAFYHERVLGAMHAAPRWVQRRLRAMGAAEAAAREVLAELAVRLPQGLFVRPRPVARLLALPGCQAAGAAAARALVDRLAAEGLITAVEGPDGPHARLASSSIAPAALSWREAKAPEVPRERLSGESPEPGPSPGPGVVELMMMAAVCLVGIAMPLFQSSWTSIGGRIDLEASAGAITVSICELRTEEQLPPRPRGARRRTAERIRRDVPPRPQPGFAELPAPAHPLRVGNYRANAWGFGHRGDVRDLNVPQTLARSQLCFFTPPVERLWTAPLPVSGERVQIALTEPVGGTCDVVVRAGGAPAVLDGRTGRVSSRAAPPTIGLPLLMPGEVVELGRSPSPLLVRSTPGTGTRAARVEACDRIHDRTWARTFAPGSRIHAPAAADLDRDGVDDLVVATDRGTVYGLSGRDGDVLFALDLEAPLDVAPQAGDLDGDGLADVVVAMGPAIVAFRAGGLPALVVARERAPQGRELLVEDFDGDGLPELLSTPRHALSVISGRDAFQLLVCGTYGQPEQVVPVYPRAAHHPWLACLERDRQGVQRVQMYSARSGKERWHRVLPRGSWRLEAGPDVDGDGAADLIAIERRSAGEQLHVLSGWSGDTVGLRRTERDSRLRRILTASGSGFFDQLLIAEPSGRMRTFEQRLELSLDLPAPPLSGAEDPRVWELTWGDEPPLCLIAAGRGASVLDTGWRRGLLWRIDGPVAACQPLFDLDGDGADEVAAATDRGLFAVHARTGRVLWSRPAPLVLSLARSARDPLGLVVAAADRLECRSARDGAALWSVPLERPPAGPVIAGGGYVVYRSTVSTVDVRGAADGRLIVRIRGLEPGAWAPRLHRLAPRSHEPREHWALQVAYPGGVHVVHALDGVPERTPRLYPYGELDREALP